MGKEGDKISAKSDLRRLERQEWYLWVLAILIIVTYTLCIVVVARPDVWQTIIKGAAAHQTFLILLSGLFILTVLLCTYLIYRERVIKNMRKELIAYHQLSAMGTLAAGLAHDLNNNLAVALGFTELLLQSELPPEVKDDVEKIRVELKEMGHILQEVLAFTRLKIKRSKPQYEVIDLGGFIESLVSQLQDELASRQVVIKKELPASPQPVSCDPHQLREAVSNILKNAMEAMEKSERKELAIRCEVVDAKCVLHISDTGPGFSPPVRAHLFEAFYTTKPLGKGTGLGLWCAKAIIDAHRGVLEVKNNQTGGALVTIKLPVAPAATPVTIRQERG